MSHILYKARNGAGEEVASFVDAATSQEAVARLKAAGLVDIELYESPDVANRHVERAFLSKSEAAQMAAFNLRVRSKPGPAAWGRFWTVRWALAGVRRGGPIAWDAFSSSWLRSSSRRFSARFPF